MGAANPQTIEYMTIDFYRDTIEESSKPITQEDISSLISELNKQIVNNQFNAVSQVEISRCKVDNTYIINFVLENLAGGPLVEIDDIEYEPYTPARMYLSNGDPGYPAEGGISGGYDSIYQFMRENFKCPAGWDYSVEDYEMDDLETLWDIYRSNDDEY